jgi:undecaprenyl diphosphate synthase
MTTSDQLNLTSLPHHIAIIMDGNGRWAEERGQNRLFGHLNGIESVRDVVEGAAEIGIQYLTLYAFSTENWNRPKYEVDGLMELLVDTIKKEVPTLNKNNIRLRVIGDVSMIPENTMNELNEALSETSVNSGMQLVMALSYSGKWEIINAVNAVSRDVAAGLVKPDTLTEEQFRAYLSTAEIPDPELMIRTSGEHRISNFLLFQLAYAELYFSPVLWPDFRKADLYEAILDFQKRERRFGKTGHQVKSEPADS